MMELADTTAISTAVPSTTPLAMVVRRLEEHNNILSFSSAIELAYTNQKMFKYPPKYARYFEPFFGFKHSTFYHIGDYNFYTPDMLEDDERKGALVIFHVIIVGISDADLTELTKPVLSGAVTHLLTEQPQYHLTSFPVEELEELGMEFNKKYGFTDATINYAAMKKRYEIPDLPEGSKVAIFTLQ